MFLKLLHFSAKWNGGFNERSSWNLSSGRVKLEPFNSRNWTIKSVIVWSWVVQQWIFSCLLFGEIYSGKPGGQSHSFSCNVCPGDFFKKSIRLEIQNERKKIHLQKTIKIVGWPTTKRMDNVALREKFQYMPMGVSRGGRTPTYCQLW